MLSRLQHAAALDALAHLEEHNVLGRASKYRELLMLARGRKPEVGSAHDEPRGASRGGGGGEAARGREAESGAGETPQADPPKEIRGKSPSGAGEEASAGVSDGVPPSPAKREDDGMSIAATLLGRGPGSGGALN